MPFTLRIFESEYREIQDLVLKYPNIETGGDLFGLWTRDADPVVQLIIGPGQKCRRTSVSFHQDTDYLQNIGTYLNTSFMLCHIGSWHSHHQLSLTHPSAGDRSTVCNNFPRGLQRYIMIIANIECSTRTGTKSVVIHPYMFTSEGHVCKKGTVEKISSSSPFRRDGQVLSKLNQGSERYQGISHIDLDRSTRATSRHGRRSPAKIDYTSYTDKTSNPHSAQQRNEYHQNSKADQWYNSDEGAAKLQEIHKQLDKKGITDVSFQRKLKTFDLTLEFRHSGHLWVVEFPKLFDRKPAQIHWNSSEPIYSKNIVEAIEKACACSRCRQSVVTPQHPSAVPATWNDVHAGNLKDSFGGNRPRSARRQQSRNEMSKAVEVPWYDTPDGKTTLESIRTDIESYLSKSKSKVKRSSSSKNVSLEFNHNNIEWILEFPSKFSENPVKLFKEQAWRQRRLMTTFARPLDALATLKQCCDCHRCRQRASSPRRNIHGAYQYANHYATEANYSAGRRVTSAKNNTAHGPKTYRTQTSRGRQQWHSSESGEERLRRICTKIGSLFLNGRQPDINRTISSGDLSLEFDHISNRWKIDFPPDYPRSLPKIRYYDRAQRDHPVQLINKDNDANSIIHTIRSNCTCSSCRRYPSARR